MSDTKAKNSSGAAVKKVAPYPIETQITRQAGQAPIKAQILKLTEIGFMAQIDASQYCKVGDTYEVSFVLPALGETIQGAAKVIKIYASVAVKGSQAVKFKTVEMHFRNLAAPYRSHIDNYLVQSGQKKK